MTSPKDGQPSGEPGPGPGPPRVDVKRVEEIAASIRPSWEQLFDPADAGVEGFRESAPGLGRAAEERDDAVGMEEPVRAAPSRPAAPAIELPRGGRTALGLAPPSTPAPDAERTEEPGAVGSEPRAGDDGPASATRRGAGERSNRARSSRRAIRPKPIVESAAAQNSPGSDADPKAPVVPAEPAAVEPTAGPMATDVGSDERVAQAVAAESPEHTSAAAGRPMDGQDLPLSAAGPGAAPAGARSLSDPRSERRRVGPRSTSSPPQSMGEESIRLPTSSSPWGKVVGVLALLGLLAGAFWWLTRASGASHGADSASDTAERARGSAPMAAPSPPPSAPAAASASSTGLATPAAPAETVTAAPITSAGPTTTDTPAPAPKGPAAPTTARPTGTSGRPGKPPTAPTTPAPGPTPTGGGLVRDVPF